MSALLALLIAVSGGDDDLAGQVERCGIARAAIEADDSEFPHVTVHAGDVTDAQSILRAHGRALDIREPDQRKNRIAVIQCVMMSALASDLPAFGYTLTAGGEAVSWTEING